MSSLSPCPTCQRHVRHDECRCPFCAAPLAACANAGHSPAPGALKRAGLLAAGMSIAAACSNVGSDTNVIPIYGAPEAPTGGAAGSAGTAGAAGAAAGGSGGASGSGAGGSAGSAGSAGSSGAAGTGGSGATDAGDAAAPALDAGDDAGD